MLLGAVVAEKIILGGLTALALFGGGMSHVDDMDSRAAPIVTSGQPSTHFAQHGRPLGSRLVHRDLDGLFRTTVIIEGNPVVMIIDTGASRSILARQTAEHIAAIQLTGQPSGRIRTLSGVQNFEIAQIETLHIGSQTLVDQELAIMETPDAVSVIGQDVLRELGPIIFHGNSVQLP